MKRVAVIGDEEFNTGFMLAGITDAYTISSDEDVVKAFEDVMKREDIGVVIFRYDLLNKLPPLLRREIEERVEPTFVAVGGSEEVVEKIRDRIRKAIGVDLWR
ncbi:MAG: V-type ATP synthase subunit F [Archaeoglobaceae archaeon]